MLKVKKSSLGIVWTLNMLGILGAVADDLQKSDSIYALETAMLVNAFFYSILFSRLKFADTQRGASQGLRATDLVVEKPSYYFHLVSPILLLDAIMLLLELLSDEISIPAAVMYPLFVLHTGALVVAAMKERRNSLQANTPFYFRKVRPQSKRDLVLYGVNLVLLYAYVFAGAGDTRFNHFMQFYFFIAVVGHCWGRYQSSTADLSDLIDPSADSNAEAAPSEVKVVPLKSYYIALFGLVALSAVDCATRFGLDGNQLNVVSALAVCLLVGHLAWQGSFNYLGTIHLCSGQARARERAKGLLEEDEERSALEMVNGQKALRHMQGITGS